MMFLISFHCTKNDPWWRITSLLDAFNDRQWIVEVPEPVVVVDEAFSSGMAELQHPTMTDNIALILYHAVLIFRTSIVD